MKKRLIEYNLPLADISEASAREKNVRHGHPSTLHIWWARRPLASSRATAFAALIDDPGPDHPEEREGLLELVKRITPWEAVKDGNSEDIERARELILKQYGRPPRVLDPFASGGSIPLEALRRLFPLLQRGRLREGGQPALRQAGHTAQRHHPRPGHRRPAKAGQRAVVPQHAGRRLLLFPHPQPQPHDHGQEGAVQRDLRA